MSWLRCRRFRDRRSRTRGESSTSTAPWKRRCGLSAAVALAVGLGSLLPLLSCGPGSPPQPEAIHPQDVCAHCRMAITDVRYAGEIVTPQKVLKFDDIGCMLTFEERLGEDIATEFVMDYDSRQWQRAEQAVYVSSDEIQTPMSFGIVAVGDSGRAAGYAREFSGQVISLGEARKLVEKR
jgi:copper chaperone NosL